MSGKERIIMKKRCRVKRIKKMKKRAPRASAKKRAALVKKKSAVRITFLERMRAVWKRLRACGASAAERARRTAKAAAEKTRAGAARLRVRAAKALHSMRAAVIRCLRFIRDGEQYYIGGSDILPPPLTPAEEADILSRLSTDRELTQVLIERNLRLVVYIAKKFENTGTDIEDIISIGTIGLIKAVNTFDPGRGIKLATYASRCIENEILMHIRKNSGKRADVSIDEPLNVDWDGNELLLSDVLSGDEDEVYGVIEHDEDYRILHRAVESLPEREQIIITLRFGLGGGPERTQAEVAKMLGISQSYISRLEKKILGDLRRTIGSGT